MENRRVFDLLHSIEVKAIQARDLHGTDAVDAAVAMDLDDTVVPVVLPMERPLYRRVRTTGLASTPVEVGVADLDRSVLFDQLHVDRGALLRTILERLGPRQEIRLDEVVAAVPLEQGLAELIGYLSIDEPQLTMHFDPDERAQVRWTAAVDGQGTGSGREDSPVPGDDPDESEQVERVADLPLVTISRHAGDGA